MEDAVPPQAAPRLAFRIPGAAVPFLLLPLLVAPPIAAQPADSLGGGPAHGLSVESDLPATGWIGRSAPIRLRLSRPLDRERERLVIFVGTTDVTDLFVPAGAGVLESDRWAPLLPEGAAELVVHRVEAGGTWTRLAAFPVRISTALGFEKAQVRPSLDLNNAGQLAEEHRPPGTGPDPRVYQDLSGRGGLQTEHLRSGWALRSQWNLAGATRRTQALRYPTEGEAAPRVDLSDYLLEVRRGPSRIAMGGIVQGSGRHLLSGFSGRGVAGDVQLGRVAAVQLGLSSGSQLVGWPDFTGLRRPEHRLFSAGLGLELLPSRPGTARVSAQWMDARRLPLAGFSQGAINDPERSRGLELQLAAVDPSGRVRLQGGVTRSAFTNPVDPFLSQGADVVPVRETTRGARFVEASVGLLPSWQITPGVDASLAASFAHERIDPLFRSIGAFAQADVEQNRFELSGNLGPVTFGGAQALAEDNLDDLASVLKTRTRTGSARASCPLASLPGLRGGGAFLPSLDYSMSRTRQYGVGIPVDGDFAASHVPDQVSMAHSGSVQWSASRWSLGYQLGWSHQDNRQAGRQAADFLTITHGLRVSFAPVPGLQVALDGSLENAESQERDETVRGRNAGTSLSWNPWPKTSVSGGWSASRRRSDLGTPRSTSSDVRADVSHAVSLPGLPGPGSAGQVFLRFARRVSDESYFEGAPIVRRGWTLNSGLTVRLS